MRVEQNPTSGTIVDLLGPTIEFMVGPEAESDFSVLRGTVAPGAIVPLHSHPDTEGFVVTEGEIQVLRIEGDDHE